MAKKNAKKAAQPAQKPQPQPQSQPQSTPTPPEPQSQSQSQSNPPQPQQPQKPSMAPSNRARLLWRTFESWAREQQNSMNADFEQLSHDMEMLWRSTPKQHRDSKVDLEKRKADQRREKQATFYEEMRTEWQKRLDNAGLRDEDWDDITEEEGVAVMKLLGGDAEVDDETVMINGTTEQVPIVPTPLSTASRSTNSSLDYDIVSPSMFRSDAEDEKTFDLFDITSFNDDTNSEASVSNPWSWESEASGYNTVNTETPQSSSHSSPKLSPDAISLGGYVKVPAARSSQLQSVSTKTSEKKKQQTRYIGPDLVDRDDHPHDDEADFASFKMEMRILKIQEFHAEAAEADIELALQIVETQSKTKVHEAVAAHEQRMLLLRQRKEAERKALVEAERQKRKKAIRERSTQRISPVRPNLFGESDKDDLSPLVQQPQKETKAGRKKKSTSTKTDESPAPTQFSQDTIRRKVAPSSDDKDKENDNWNPFEYDINALLATIPGSMPPPIGSSFPTLTTAPTDAAASSQQNSRPPPASRTASSTSRINGREFWVPPAASEIKQAPAPNGKIATANSRFDPPNPTNLTAIPQDIKPIASRSSSFTRQGEPPADLQSHSATSSKTTLEDMRPTDSRSFRPPPSMTKSASNLNLNPQPNRHEIWIPPSQDTSRARALSSATRRPPEPQVVSSSSNVSHIQKSQSMPKGPEVVTDTKRSRRMSDPVSPSPRSFLLPVENNGALGNNSATGIPAKGKAGKGGGKGKRVTIEDVPDDDEENFEHLPSDSKHIMEPKPVVPTAMFEQILDYEEEVTSIPPKATDWDKVMEDKAARTKHVRWTPSVVGGSPVSVVVPDDDKDLPRWPNGRDRKGKGKMVDSGDDLSRFAKEALVGLKQMGGKAR